MGQNLTEMQMNHGIVESVALEKIDITKKAIGLIDRWLCMVGLVKRFFVYCAEKLILFSAAYVSA